MRTSLFRRVEPKTLNCGRVTPQCLFANVRPLDVIFVCRMPNLPLIHSESNLNAYPETDTCTHCSKPYDRNGKYVAFDAMALLSKDESLTEADQNPLTQLSIGFWDVQNFAKYEGSKLYLLRRVPGGLAMIFFCSTQCMRAFFNSVIDRLEAGEGEPIISAQVRKQLG